MDDSRRRLDWTGFVSMQCLDGHININAQSESAPLVGQQNEPHTVPIRRPTQVVLDQTGTAQKRPPRENTVGVSLSARPALECG